MKKFSVLSLFVFCLTTLLAGFVFMPTANVAFADEAEGNTIVFSSENLPVGQENVSSWFADYVNGYGTANAEDNIVLESDIDLKNFPLTNTIGTKENPFSGTFNGNGHRISNYTLTLADENAALASKTEQNFGLFGVVSGENAVVSNLEIAGRVSIYVSPCNPANIGVLCGNAQNGARFEFIQIDVSVLDIGNSHQSSTDPSGNPVVTVNGKVAGDCNVNLGLLAGVVQDCKIEDVICRLTKIEDVDFSLDDNITANIGGVIGEFDNSKMHFAVVETDLTVKVQPSFVGNVNVGGVVGNVINFGSEIINVAVENNMKITAPESGLAEVYAGDVVGKVDSLTPKAGNLSCIHYKNNAGLNSFGNNGSYLVSRDVNITATAADLTLSDLQSDENGSYTYFTAATQIWKTIEVGSWNFNTVWYVNSGTIYLQAFADEFRISITGLDENVLRMETTLASSYTFGESVEIEFSFVDVQDGEETKNMHDFYSVSGVELADREVAKIEDNKTSYRVTTGADLYDIRATDNGFMFIIKKMSLATSGTYSINTSWRDFSVEVGTQLFEKGQLIEGSPAYVYYGINDEMENFTLSALKFGDESTIYQRAKLNEPVAFVGWFVLKGEDVIDLSEGGESLTFTFGKGVFTGNCKIVARYSRDACDVVFNMDDGVLRIVCNGNTITSTNQTFALPKNKQDLRLEVYIKNGYNFNTEEFIEFMDTFKSSGTAFCKQIEDYETDEGHYYHFDLDMTTLYGDYANNFTIDTKTTLASSANNTWIWIVVGVVAGALVLGVAIFLIVFFAKRRGGGFGGGKMPSAKVSKKSYKNMYY